MYYYMLGGVGFIVHTTYNVMYYMLGGVGFIVHTVCNVLYLYVRKGGVHSSYCM